MEKLEFLDLKIGMKVQDSHGNISVIKKCENIHNILVQFEKLGSGGYGFYSLDTNDTYFESLYRLNNE